MQAQRILRRKNFCLAQKSLTKGSGCGLNSGGFRRGPVVAVFHASSRLRPPRVVPTLGPPDQWGSKLILCCASRVWRCIRSASRGEKTREGQYPRRTRSALDLTPGFA